MGKKQNPKVGRRYRDLGLVSSRLSMFYMFLCLLFQSCMPRKDINRRSDVADCSGEMLQKIPSRQFGCLSCFPASRFLSIFLLVYWQLQLKSIENDGAHAVLIMNGAFISSGGKKTRHLYLFRSCVFLLLSSCGYIVFCARWWSPVLQEFGSLVAFSAKAMAMLRGSQQSSKEPAKNISYTWHSLRQVANQGRTF